MITRASRIRLVRFGARTASGPSFIAGALLVAFAVLALVGFSGCTAVEEMALRCDRPQWVGGPEERRCVEIARERWQRHQAERISKAGA